ncbi:MAG: monovalent cation/H(+) antiporter subunit G, partial [Burkholderiaceae bacterium]
MSPLPLWLDLFLSALLILGAVFALAGSWALARLGTFMTRVHGPTMTMTMGAGLVLLASAIAFSWHGTPSLHEVLIVFFLFLTVPASGQMLVKAVLKREAG